MHTTVDGSWSLDDKAVRAAFGAVLNNATRNAGPKATAVTLSATTHGQWLVIGIADTAGGIPAELRRRVGDLFFSTHLPPGGLGLAGARRVASAHGGFVVQTPIPNGTRTDLVFAAGDERR